VCHYYPTSFPIPTASNNGFVTPRCPRKLDVVAGRPITRQGGVANQTRDFLLRDRCLRPFIRLKLRSASAANFFAQVDPRSKVNARTRAVAIDVNFRRDEIFLFCRKIRATPDCERDRHSDVAGESHRAV